MPAPTIIFDQEKEIIFTIHTMLWISTDLEPVEFFFNRTEQVGNRPIQWYNFARKKPTPSIYSTSGDTGVSTQLRPLFTEHFSGKI